MSKLYKKGLCNVYVALLHYPVLNKNAEIIASAITNLDLHDIARVSRTYGVKAFYVITPYDDQIVLVNRIIEHWIEGVGSVYNPKRKQALELIRVSPSYDAVINNIKIDESCMPKTVATTARPGFTCRKYENLRNELVCSYRSYVLTFGTAWGLPDDFLRSADCILGPIKGPGDYNHLSVRSAVSIVLDRLLGH